MSSAVARNAIAITKKAAVTTRYIGTERVPTTSSYSRYAQGCLIENGAFSSILLDLPLPELTSAAATSLRH